MTGRDDEELRLLRELDRLEGRWGSTARSRESEIHRRLQQLGAEAHVHGDNTEESPLWSHIHSYKDPYHEHDGEPGE